MACYDCEDCNEHIDNGGKCTKFEYDCVYSLVENTDKEIVNQIHEKAILIQKLLDEIKDLDSESMLYYEVSSLKNTLEDIIESSSEQMLNEWDEIIK